MIIAIVLGIGFFVLVAFAITALRTNVPMALLETTIFVGIGWLLGRLLVRPQGWAARPADDGRPYRPAG